MLTPPTEGDAVLGQLVDHVSPPSLVSQTPPDARPANMMLGLVGWTASARMRPGMLRGPLGIQLPCWPASRLPTAAARRRSREPGAGSGARPRARTVCSGG